MNGHLILGIGIGIIIASIAVLPYYGRTSSTRIELEARKMGMIYRDEIKVME